MNRRLFVEKKAGFRVEAESLRHELNLNLALEIPSLRILNIYDLAGFTDDLLDKCRYGIFAEVVSDTVTESADTGGFPSLAIESLPGQFDQRASSALECVHLIDPLADVTISSGRLIIFECPLSEKELDAIRRYCINPIEAREKDMGAFASAQLPWKGPATEPVEGFISLQKGDLAPFIERFSLAMGEADLEMAVDYFKNEGREPTLAEVKILDTYWSDHCRHTTFGTRLTDIDIEDSFFKPSLEAMLAHARDLKNEAGRGEKPLTLMELATIGARVLRSRGRLEDLEVSEENNACSIFVDADCDGEKERWLLQFKNETHNHPTEIEPFGGASTCLGGAIRDPLSGRAYVYQAMRVTGAGNIAAPVSEALEGKLPQKVISTKAAAGYSSYGNQIGIATTHVREIFHEGYTAKRMEVGAVVGAVKASDVRRESPAPGDIILLLGGRTGRDGIGGATGSSKGHTSESLTTCGSEVQKGNAPEERKLLRLFKRPDVCSMIKKSNDFGAGGVSVAIGELAPGLEIYLDRIPVKYLGINGTELAISESQERMAVVIEAADKGRFMECCSEENVEVTHVADVTSTGRMRLMMGGEMVADLSREFIDSAGAPRSARVTMAAPSGTDPFAREWSGDTLGERVEACLASPNVGSQRGMVEMFDSTIGSSTVLLPYGGRYQATESQVSVQKLPVGGETDTASMMAFGFNPDLSSWSPCHGAAYAVVEACAKVAAAGGDYSRMRFSFQEYFERLGSAPEAWGKPLSALLGALKMQMELGLPAIGGKDSMSGSFGKMHVPPTLIAFGITATEASGVISPEFKSAGNRVWILRHNPLPDYMPDSGALAQLWSFLRFAIGEGAVVSAWASGFGGVAEAVAKMSFGNRLGCSVTIGEEELFRLSYGSVVVEADPAKGALEECFRRWCGTCKDAGADAADLRPRFGIQEIGSVTAVPEIEINGVKIPISTLQEANECWFAQVYPLRRQHPRQEPPQCEISNREPLRYGGDPVEHPRVLIPVFPGTNCDYDTAAAFRNAGAEVEFLVFRNITPEAIQSSISELCEALSRSHIMALSGGFSLGDEPDGSGKFIAAVLNNPDVAAQVNALLGRRGLVLGICNGFQALVKSGLLPFGKLGELTEDSPTLFRNDINRHVATISPTSVESVASPWLSGFRKGEIHHVAISHGEGRFVVGPEVARELFSNSQVAFRYTDNPNGSAYDIEGIVSPDGLVLGKMGHSERCGSNLYRNYPEPAGQSIFTNAVNYFKQKKS